MKLVMRTRRISLAERVSMSRHGGPNGGLRVGDLRFLIQGGRSLSSVSIGSFVHDVVVGSGWELIGASELGGV